MQAKSFCVLEYAKCSSVTSVQRAFLRKYGKAAPGHQSILRWFRETDLDDVPLLPWVPDLTPCDFFLWVYVKDKIYVPPMPTTLQALQERMTVAVTETCYRTSGRN
ncbi:hypothetical protein AVEN_243343-1 [Araneus ventricosus]|uniref:DUF4817 domain-containing protein n=1 Tax=Araneus ventricosus TaxID=182803 RepID=A0A4Y2HBD5_ARAVE|nr:hypothetical protein AVEN_243343-1 [Araneus ventricosus]